MNDYEFEIAPDFFYFLEEYLPMIISIIFFLVFFIIFVNILKIIVHSSRRAAPKHRNFDNTRFVNPSDINSHQSQENYQQYYATKNKDSFSDRRVNAEDIKDRPLSEAERNVLYGK